MISSHLLPSLSTCISLFLGALTLVPGLKAYGSVQFSRDFAPQEGIVATPELPLRQELCLNGLWQFQPVPVPRDYQRNRGIAPELPPPLAQGWSATPIKIPSPWNVNRWGCGRREQLTGNRQYWPDSVYFPSYPVEWDHAQMGWLRRSFRMPPAWQDRRIILHFEAVAGECQVFVNGQKVTEHFDTWLPFEADITDRILRDGDNELLVGVRQADLFNKSSERYPKFLAPYPPGSQTDSLAGIWQDVSLLAVPNIRVTDTFIKPLVSKGVLEAEVALLNSGRHDQTVKVDGEVCPWIQQASSDVLSQPEPNWKLNSAVVSIPAKSITLKAGQRTTIVLRKAIDTQLQLWSPTSPNLYGLVLSIHSGDQIVDRKYARFGWRELTIRGSDLLLNGEKIQMTGDFVHPFGPYMMSRRFVWAFYKMIKDFGGNSVRPHAQIHPRCFLDLADEMGLLVLDETSVFGSSIKLNPDEPLFWDRYARHYDGMVLRDRNHPSVMGWSFGNEMFAIPLLNKMKKEDVAVYDQKLIAMSRRALDLDSTRTWISCDGDEDLNGSLPVWSKHYGHNRQIVKLPNGLNKPLMIGESGGTYYATPEQLSMFNGDRAFESYLGRNEALAIDLYDNVAHMVLPNLAYFSASEIAWFGLEHLNFGYSDFSRLPTIHDGVLFSKPFIEGKPGMQIERIPPYVTTLNPGWDTSLPVYKPLPMFLAMKAALAKGGPQPCAWDHVIKEEPKTIPPVPARARQAVFVGGDKSALRERLLSWGVPFADGPDAPKAQFMIVDGNSLSQTRSEALRSSVNQVLAGGGTVLIMLCEETAPLAALNPLLPASIELTSRKATQLQSKGEQAWTAGLSLKDLYFAGAKGDRQILKCGISGPLVEKGRVILEAGNIDWSLFNEVPEMAKASAVVLYEQMNKPPGAALVRVDQGKGTLAVCTLDYRIASPSSDKLWRRLLMNMGLQLQSPKTKTDKGVGEAKAHDLLLNGPMQ